MQDTTRADRERELRSLLDRIAASPDKAWADERARVAVLQTLLASEVRASA